MKYRLLGILCIILSLPQLIDGFRWATLGLTTPDTFSLVANIALDAGALCGLWGLLSLKATGSNPIFGVLTFLPAAGHLSDLINNLQQMARVAGPDAPLSIAGGMLILFGWLVVGILTIAAKQWRDWRRFTPILVSLAFPAAVALRSITHVPGLISIIMAGTLVLLGYAVQSSPIAMTRPTVLAQPGMSRNL
jgi:hypothetical protein